MAYERDNITRLAAYRPGEQPQPAPGHRVVKLNTNENPYPPPEVVLDAIRAVSAHALRRYPPASAQRFREVAAQIHGLAPDQVIATNGGDELLRLAFTVFSRPRQADVSMVPPQPDGAQPGLGQSPTESPGGVGVSDPTYSLYQVLAHIQDTPMTQIPLAADDALPEDFADRLNAAGCRLALLVNPHAPSGRLRSLVELERIARVFAGVLLIDEAYVDFATHDALPLLHPDMGLENVLLLRSLSKGYSLAGLRFGYGLGHRDLIAALDKARDSYNTGVLSQAAAIAALEHRDAAAKTWRAVIDERGRLSEALARRGFTVMPSQSNFILAKPPLSTTASNLYQSLKTREIYVRYFDMAGLRDKLRITIGTPEENDLLLAALDRISKQDER